MYHRYVDPVLPLAPYDWLESYCRLLHHDAAANGALWGIGGAFLGCARLRGPAGRFAVLTESSLVVFDTDGAREALDVAVSGIRYSDRRPRIASSGCRGL